MRMSVTHVLCGAALLLAFACRPATAAGIRLIRPVTFAETPMGGFHPEDNRLLVAGKAVMDMPLGPLRYSALVYATLNGEQAAKAGLKGPTLLLFTGEGALAKEIPFAGAESCSAVSLSPGGTVLAIDSGHSASRTWTFFDYAGLERLGEPLAYTRESQSGDRELLWANENTALVPVRELPENRGRECGEGGVCGRLSVFLRHIRTGKTAPVLRGTPECDYRPLGIKDGKILADKLCESSPKGWWDGKGGERTSGKVAVPLPGGQGQ